MGLAEYKFIFFWEWVHRLIGRLIGVAFALPLAWFALTAWIVPLWAWWIDRHHEVAA